MRVVMMFDLDDLDDRLSHLRCTKSIDMALAMWTFTEKLRNLVKTSEDGQYLDEAHVWDAWNDSLVEYDVNLDKLVV